MLSYPAQALPGDSIRDALEKFRRNPFFRGLQLSIEESGRIQQSYDIFHYLFGRFPGRSYSTGYPSKGRYMNYNFSYYLRTNDRRGIVFLESIGYDLNSKYPSIRLYKNRNFDVRQETLLIDTISRVWGDNVSKDFIGSRFTDMIEIMDEPQYGSAIRRVYQGKAFAYQITAKSCLSSNCSNDGLDISVILPNYIQGFRLIGEFEKRI
jgi:hypothetical protein